MNYIPLYVFIYLVLQMSLVWGIYRLIKNPSVVDVSWSLGLMIAGLIYMWSVPITSRTVIVSVLLILWAFRLAGYLWYTRIRHGHVDKRYTELSNSWKLSPSLGFFLNFQLQGLLIFIISLVFFYISSAHSSLTVIDALAVMLVLMGIAGETLADYQLTQFKSQKKGGVCSLGLWNYCRHPNYFFDWLSWSGFTLFALQGNRGYLGLLSLFCLYLIFTRVTGPMTERGSVQSRGQAYIDYQNQTSMFFPWFKRKK